MCLKIWTKCDSISECASIQRIISGLLYYQTLTNQDNNNDNHYGKHIFSDCLCELYPHYLDDIIHLSIKHCDDLEEINNILLNHSQYKKCNIKKCIFSHRHCNILDGLNGDINLHK